MLSLQVIIKIESQKLSKIFVLNGGVIMSYLSTDSKLVGSFKIKKHAVDRFRDRHGNEYIGNKKIKNMSDNKLKRKIRKSLKKRVRGLNEQEDGSLEVYTKDFKAIVVPSFRNIVVTII